MSEARPDAHLAAALGDRRVLQVGVAVVALLPVAEADARALLRRADDAGRVVVRHRHAGARRRLGEAVALAEGGGRRAVRELRAELRAENCAELRAELRTWRTGALNTDWTNFCTSIASGADPVSIIETRPPRSSRIFLKTIASRHLFVAPGGGGGGGEVEAEVVAVAEVEEEVVVVQAALALTDAAGVEVGDAALECHTEEPADDGALRGDLALDAGVHLVEDGGGEHHDRRLERRAVTELRTEDGGGAPSESCAPRLRAENCAPRIAPRCAPAAARSV